MILSPHGPVFFLVSFITSKSTHSLPYCSVFIYLSNLRAAVAATSNRAVGYASSIDSQSSGLLGMEADGLEASYPSAKPEK